jgi:hypothetical protein
MAEFIRTLSTTGIPVRKPLVGLRSNLSSNGNCEDSNCPGHGQCDCDCDCDCE